MSCVSQKHTKPEIIVRKFLFANRLRYRINYKNLPGSPDIVLPKYKTAIFVHGCFWHGHLNCRLSKRPTSNLNYWNKKLDENLVRDKKKIISLKKIGWNVIVLWQCQLNDKNLKKLLSKIKV